MNQYPSQQQGVGVSKDKRQGSIGVIAVDDGGYSTGVVTRERQEMFPSVKGRYGVRNITEVKGKYDFIVEYNGEKYVMGDLAKYDCAIPLEMHSETKQHLFFDLSTLVAIHQYGYDQNLLMISVPIRMHNNKEKLGRIRRLKGEHTVIVNGRTRTFNITDVKVAPESAVAFWNKKVEGVSRYIDIGSRTIGYATTIFENGVTRFIDSESGTIFAKGISALGEQYTPEGLGEYIYGTLSKIFKPDDIVYLLGGGSLDKKLVQVLRTYYPKAIVMENPQMANALGMYVLGRNAYGLH